MNNHLESKANVQEIKGLEFNLYYIYELIKHYIWYIVTIVLLSGILAIVFTMPAFYKPEFLSGTVIYPTNPERFDLDNLFSVDNTVFLFGSSKEVEKLKNIADARSLKLAVIDSLDLWDAYGINKEDDESPEHYALEIYNGYVRTIQVEGNGLKIEAYDQDPQRAADIVNLIVSLIDRKNKEMLIQNKDRILALYKRTEKELQQKLLLYKDSALETRRKYNIYDFERQTEALMKEILSTESKISLEKARLAAYSNQRSASDDTLMINSKARLTGLNNHLSKLYGRSGNSPLNLEKFALGMDQINILERFYLDAYVKLKETQQRIEVIEVMANADYSTILSVEKALSSDRKARPVRWLILLAALMIGSLVSVIGVILVDRFVQLTERK